MLNQDDQNRRPCAHVCRQLTLHFVDELLVNEVIRLYVHEELRVVLIKGNPRNLYITVEVLEVAFYSEIRKNFIKRFGHSSGLTLPSMLLITDLPASF